MVVVSDLIACGVHPVSRCAPFLLVDDQVSLWVGRVSGLADVCGWLVGWVGVGWLGQEWAGVGGCGWLWRQRERGGRYRERE